MHQDTGNPVLDSFVNVAVGSSVPREELQGLYATIRELALKEPGGLKRRSGAGSLEAFNYDNTDSEVSLLPGDSTL
jgi:hypothetical protein